jgi:hypothetical protein
MPAKIYLIIIASLLCGTAGCRQSGPPLDLLNLTIDEHVGDVVNRDYDEISASTDTYILPGTLNISVGNIERFLIAGVRLPPDDDYSGADLNLLLYSPSVMSDYADRVAAETGGGEFAPIDLPEGDDLAAAIESTGAVDQIIGISISYRGTEPFISDVTNALKERLGEGTATQIIDTGIYWLHDGRYIAVAPTQGVVMFLAEEQAIDGCLSFGNAALFDVGGCDVEAFIATYPQSMRTEPTLR